MGLFRKKQFDKKKVEATTIFMDEYAVICNGLIDYAKSKDNQKLVTALEELRARFEFIVPTSSKRAADLIEKISQQFDTLREILRQTTINEEQAISLINDIKFDVNTLSSLRS